MHLYSSHPLRTLSTPLMHLTRTPYTPYLLPLHALRAPLTCLMQPYVPYAHPLLALRALLMRLTCTPYTPYAHPLRAPYL